MSRFKNRSEKRKQDRIELSEYRKAKQKPIPKPDKKGTYHKSYVEDGELKDFKLTKSEYAEVKRRIQTRNKYAKRIITSANKELEQGNITPEEHRKLLENVKVKKADKRSILGSILEAPNPEEKYRKLKSGLGRFNKTISDISRRKVFKEEGNLALIEAFEHNLKANTIKAVEGLGDTFQKEILLEMLNNKSISAYDLKTINIFNPDLTFNEFYEDPERQQEAVNRYIEAIEEEFDRKGIHSEVMPKIHKNASRRYSKKMKTSKR